MMQSNVKTDETIIALSKIKLALALLACLLFVALGVWLGTLEAQDIRTKGPVRSPIFVYALSIVTMLFFGFCSIVAVIKLFSRKPGLVLNANGIIDSSGARSTTLIHWSEITALGEYQIQAQKFISVFLKNPEAYIQKGGYLKRKLNQTNYKMSGTPVNISANNLKISYQQLLTLLQNYISKYGHL